MNIMMPSIEDGHVIQEGKPRIQELLSVANRLYGSSLLGFAVLVWSLWRTADKGLARNLMAATAISEWLQFGALFSHSWYTGNWDTTIKLHIAVHLVSAVGSGYFFWAIGSSTAGLRKTPSYKDLTEQTQDESSGFDCYESHTPKSTSTSSAPDAKKKD